MNTKNCRTASKNGGTAIFAVTPFFEADAQFSRDLTSTGPENHKISSIQSSCSKSRNISGWAPKSLCKKTT